MWVVYSVLHPLNLCSRALLGNDNGSLPGEHQGKINPSHSESLVHNCADGCYIKGRKERARREGRERERERENGERGKVRKGERRKDRKGETKKGGRRELQAGGIPGD